MVCVSKKTRESPMNTNRTVGSKGNRARRLMALLELTGRNFDVQSDAFTPPALGSSSWVGQCIRECGISNGTCSDSCGLCSKTARKRCHLKVGVNNTFKAKKLKWFGCCAKDNSNTHHRSGQTKRQRENPTIHLRWYLCNLTPSVGTDNLSKDQ